MANGYASQKDVRDTADDVVSRMSQLMSLEREYREQQHAENRALMQSMLTEARRTNGRITTLEQIVKTLQDEFATVRQRWHSFRDSTQDALSRALVGVGGKGELSPVTRKDLSIAVGILILGMTAMLTLMKIIGKA
jgi:hypothetical protein